MLDDKLVHIVVSLRGHLRVPKSIRDKYCELTGQKKFILYGSGAVKRHDSVFVNIVKNFIRTASKKLLQKFRYGLYLIPDFIANYDAYYIDYFTDDDFFGEFVNIDLLQYRLSRIRRLCENSELSLETKLEKIKSVFIEDKPEVKLDLDYTVTKSVKADVSKDDSEDKYDEEFRNLTISDNNVTISQKLNFEKKRSRLNKRRRRLLRNRSTSSGESTDSD